MSTNLKKVFSFKRISTIYNVVANAEYLPRNTA